MALSPQSTQNLIKAIAPDVIEYITEDERFVDVMTEVIGDAIVDKLGKLDFELYAEVVATLSGYIGLSFDPNAIS